jgi:geranylgeranylglycerol-phosphate geranylgeranyltransferase
MNKIVAVAKLTRIEHSLMLVVAVLAAELIVGGLPGTTVLLLSLITPILISMGAFAINDYFDVGADKANGRMDRPIVSGAITKRGAYYIAMFCLVVGSLASLFINMYAFIIAIVFAVLSYLYSYKLKDTLLLGNAIVAFSMVIPFIYGNFVVSNLINMNIVLISLVVFLSGLAREVHGMVRDRVGDLAARKSRNLVYSIGAKNSSLFALTLYVEGIAVSIFMFFYAWPFKYNLVYIVPITVVNLVFLYISYGYIAKGTRKFFGLSRNLSLAAMAVALLTYLLSAIVYIAA